MIIRKVSKNFHGSGLFNLLRIVGLGTDIKKISPRTEFDDDLWVVVEVDSCKSAWEAFLSCYVLECAILTIDACLQNYSWSRWLNLYLNVDGRVLRVQEFGKSNFNYDLSLELLLCYGYDVVDKF